MLAEPMYLFTILFYSLRKNVISSETLSCFKKKLFNAIARRGVEGGWGGEARPAAPNG